MAVKITGTGSFIPPRIIENTDFLNEEFLNEDGSKINSPNEVIIKKFQAITGIAQRRYVAKNTTTSDIASIAAKKAIEDAEINPETLDYIIVAHNFGDVKYRNTQSDAVPSLAARVKHQLQIENPNCVAYDLIFGCPGWLQGVIQAKAFIDANIAKRCLVIGAETLSRVVDKHDRDSMIFSDGAGATIIEKTTSEGDGIIFHKSATYAKNESHYLTFEASYNQDLKRETRYIKMSGRKIYSFALTHVPQAMKECIDNSGYNITDIKKIFIHQANEKMDFAICERLYKLYQLEMPKNIMPMSIAELGNSSVATLPTLIDLVKAKKIDNQEIHKGDVILFASVGAGMNINAMIYKI
ncbi:3-oxoacyl-[acyl-carrier-protein] synthase-3 [Mesonia hippocampi]|uniref:3-oxoacyl-[acyl-carrier-protein] synthase-3 n=1 Tax=Mesonia hippocampi TaxID=1628250 RepID=A0A840ETX2_9FLAO|nr:ketoacyl-ACP synthase III [Mesonia hippocampi]MBB4119963.1 3-oxoacyl-[acyl-carrier-protein] synthase-3 [Mesonia hippocampi]